ncbi:MAG: phenylacetate--CoA ligase family protein [Inquilinus sp.]|nr:phenylacetate--CoA ligase family protein [Inquilinus sp.]
MPDGGMLSAAAGSLRYVGHSAFLSAKGLAIRQLRGGAAFRARLAELEESQWAPMAVKQAAQDARLRELVRHAYDNVPFYRRSFDRHGIRPEAIDGVEDLQRLPTLDKSEIRANPEDFVARGQSQRLIATGWTTGTTGAPLGVRRTLESIVYDKAILARQRRWAGIDIDDRNVAIWGTVWSNVIVPRAVRSPPYWRFNAADNQLLFSYYHLSDETLPLFVDKLRAFQPAYIEAFPSTMLAFARFLNRRGEVVPVRAVFTSSEPLYAGHRQEIEAAFATRIYDYYGHAERAVTAAECPHGRMHVNPEYGALEILQGDVPAPAGQSGEIIGTGLTNFGMPLIRYRTGDSTRAVTGPCPCGRETPLIGPVEGRAADFIRTPDGRLMPGDGVMEAFYGIDNVKESQVVQEAIDRIVVRLVKDETTAPVDDQRLRANLLRCLGPEMNVTVEYRQSIWEKAEMKKRWVVSKIGAGLDKIGGDA